MINEQNEGNLLAVSKEEYMKSVSSAPQTDKQDIACMVAATVLLTGITVAKVALTIKIGKKLCKKFSRKQK